MIAIELQYPAKELWPNGRPHRMAKARKAKTHFAWAITATAKALQSGSIDLTGDGPIPVHIVVHGRPTGSLPDADNVVASCKAYLDGIAFKLGVNDRRFAAPTVSFMSPRSSRFVIQVGALAD